MLQYGQLLLKVELSERIVEKELVEVVSRIRRVIIK